MLTLVPESTQPDFGGSEHTFSHGTHPLHPDSTLQGHISNYYRRIMSFGMRHTRIACGARTFSTSRVWGVFSSRIRALEKLDPCTLSQTRRHRQSSKRVHTENALTTAFHSEDASGLSMTPVMSRRWRRLHSTRTS